MYLPKRTKEKLLQIAKENSYIIQKRGDLQYRFNDSEDFIEVSVGSLKEMLRSAYELGYNEGKEKE